jgi:hypothetical protein
VILARKEQDGELRRDSCRLVGRAGICDHDLQVDVAAPLEQRAETLAQVAGAVVADDDDAELDHRAA